MFDWFFPERRLMKMVAELRDEFEARDRRRDEEWTEMYDKFRRILARMSKRTEREETAQEPPGATIATNGHSNAFMDRQRLLAAARAKFSR